MIKVWANFNDEHTPGNLSNNSGNYLHIHIQDNGIGFNEMYVHKMFALFQRLHGKDEYGGTGIGLAIVKNNRKT